MVRSLDIEPCALFRTVDRFVRRKEDEQQVTVIVDVGWRRSQVVIGRGREINFVKPVEIGGHQLQEAVARKLGISLDEAQALLYRDDLTGLYNRRQLQTELEQARLEANAGVAPFSMCLIDIDRFKEINDGNGHLAGDTILKEFSRLARNSIRDSDVLGRYGGDEFLLILKDTDLKGAVMHAERLRVYAHFLDFQKVLAQKHISLSIGVAQYRKGEKITDLISRADSALYQAKQLGRNRVEWREE